MKIFNIKYYRDLPFGNYLKMPGTSFSSTKGEITHSAGLALGSRVHAYINEPSKYDWQQVEEVKAISATLRAYLGSAFNSFEKEIAFTCDMEHNGMQLQYKGRADLLRIGRIVVDLKVLSGPLEYACTRFGYNHQISGYCLPNKCDIGLIIAYNKLTKRVEVKKVIPTPDFWNYQIIRFGSPVKQGSL